MKHAFLLRCFALMATTALAANTAMAASTIPQMQPASFPGQLAWLAISFVLLYALVSLFIAPRIAGILAVRETAIREAIDKAEALKAAAGTTRGDFEAAGAQARSTAAAMIATAQADAAKAAADAQAKLAITLDAKAQAARARITGAMEKARSEVDGAAHHLAQAMTEKLLSTAPMVAKTTKKAS